jgi:DNA-binding MarR family transcriptional regulator
MAIVHKIEKRARLGKEDIIRFQLMTYCFLNQIRLSESELHCLVTLAREEEQDLNVFCQQSALEQIYATAQTVRNAVNKLTKKGLLFKKGNTHKKVLLHPDVQLQTMGNILLDFKFVHIDATNTPDKI